MLKVPRSNKSGLKYSGLVEILTVGQSVLSSNIYLISLVFFISPKVNIHLSPYPHQLNKFDYMAGIIPKYMESVSENSLWEVGGGGSNKPHKFPYHKPSALGCLNH